MAALDDLLARIDDPALRADIERELAPLRSDRELGLVFERHLPEKVRLPGLKLRRGSTVEVRSDQHSPTWDVVKVIAGEAQLRRRDNDGTTLTETLPIEELVVVREFGQPVYPGLKSVGRIERGGDKPFHTVINAENYHALETLLYTCEGQVDAIYIDPPYNTGAKDWKYNNDYVDGGDGYRHSKWLSFMEKRLLLAKLLLNPQNSTLIVTIDEKEYLRLGLLLQQLFPAASIQMVSIVINHRGVARAKEFTRVDEYAFFVFLGDAGPCLVSDDLLTEVPAADDARAKTVRWEPLMKGSNNARRVDRPNLFYPIFVDPTTKKVLSVGDALPLSQDKSSVSAPKGSVAVWPVSPNGEEKRWQCAPATLRDLLEDGYVQCSSYDSKNDRWTILYLNRGQRERIERGEIRVTGQDANGVVVAEMVSQPLRAGRTIWNRQAHNAGFYGSGVVSPLIGGKKFPFPKSLYAVEDALRFAVGENPHALIVDFFSGSGTTAHAVMRLNRQDGGRRRSISVTNNEVGAEAEADLLALGLKPGDHEWEARGIFEEVTKPRITAAVSGHLADGTPVKGEYKFTDEFPMSDGLEENVEFFELTYEDPDRVRLGTEFAAVAPLLWLMAGAVGPRIDKLSGAWKVPAGGRYGVLFDADAWPDFVETARSSESLTHAFIVTDSDTVFQRVVAELPDTVTPVRLYESYLRSFAINTGAQS